MTDFIDVRVYFDTEVEVWEEDDETYVHRTPVSCQVVNTNIDDNGLEAIAEAAHQSDLYTVGVTNAFLDALDNKGIRPVSRY